MKIRGGLNHKLNWDSTRWLISKTIKSGERTLHLRAGCKWVSNWAPKLNEKQLTGILFSELWPSVVIVKHVGWQRLLQLKTSLFFHLLLLGFLVRLLLQRLFVLGLHALFAATVLKDGLAWTLSPLRVMLHDLRAFGNAFQCLFRSSSCICYQKD